MVKFYSNNWKIIDPGYCTLYGRQLFHKMLYIRFNGSDIIVTLH